MIELAVSVAILGIIAALVTVSATAAISPVPMSPIAAAVAEAEGEALRTGKRALRIVKRSDGGVAITAFPDGRTVIDSLLPTPPASRR